MAKVTVNKEVTEVVKAEEFVLTLTRAEAETLAIITGKVTGSPSYSRRKHTSAVFNALVTAGASYHYGRDHLERGTKIYFEEDPSI